ncbi:MAG: hypothetical protein ABIP75_03415 [Pyrinomonadaceae bacterium]
MNDYLWDGSGEPDGDIEQLELLLRPLSYKAPAEPYAVPALVVAVPVKRAPLYRWAVAATIAVFALSLGFWLIRAQPDESVALATLDRSSISDLTWTERAIKPTVTVDPIDSNHVVSVPRHTVAVSNRGDRGDQRLRAELKEGRVAADQLLKALRITSDNLNLVKTKVNQVGATTPES